MMRGKMIRAWSAGLVGMATLLAAGTPASGAQAPAQPGTAPESILPVPQASPAPLPAPVPAPAASPVPAAPGAPVVAPPAAPVLDPVMTWTLADAQALLGVITAVDEDGLIPADYQPDALRAAIAAGAGAALDAQASRSFTWLVEDMRDGRTRMDSRHQWFVVDPDVDLNPTAQVMTQALASHDIAGAIAALAPTHPDYRALKAALAATPKAEKAARNQ